MKICVIKGDGIGPEVVDASLEVLNALNLNIIYSEAEAGYECYKNHGTSLPEETIRLAKESDAIFLGAVTTPPDIPNYRSAVLGLRKSLELFANIRPVKSYPLEQFRKNVDLLVVRENTEGLYSGKESFDGETAITQRIITKSASERIAKYAFEMAKNKVTIIHKANILRETCGLFRRTAFEVAKNYPNIIAEECIVDAMAMRLIKQPETFDVVLASNMFGDILSDEASMLVGGLGLASSGNIGTRYSMFEPVHGSAPKYAGRNKANPLAAILSAKLMLEHLDKAKAAAKIDNAVRKVIVEKNSLTFDLGGKSTTAECTQAVIEALE